MLALLFSVSAQTSWTTLAPTALRPVLPLSPELVTALSDRDHATAAELLVKYDHSKISGHAVGDLAFLQAWTLHKAGRDSEAIRLIDALQQADHAPATYIDLLTGELMVDDGRAVEALPILERISGDSAIYPRARLALAEAYQKAGRTADARAVYEALLTRPDPATGSARALWTLAQRAGLESEAGKNYLRRLYRYYPGSAEDKAAAASYGTPTIEDIAWRGYTEQEDGDYNDAVQLLAPRLAEAGTKDAAGCRYRYAYGRALHKTNNLTLSIEVLGPLGRSCKGIEDDLAARSLYIAGKSHERKKEWGSAANYYRLIPDLYPDHRMADDGYVLGGIALQETGDLTGARGLWSKGLERYPDGDMTPEGGWRLAWAWFLAGDTPTAIQWADKLKALPLHGDATHVLAGAYWASRWRVWPSLTDPRAQSSDPAMIAAGTDGFEAMARDMPWHYYSLLAAGRLQELAPERAKNLKRPTMDSDEAPWQVRDSFLAQPAARNGLDLTRIGLYADALTEFGTLDTEELSGSEMAIVTAVQTMGGDFLFAHDRMRSWLKSHPPTELGPNTYKVMRQAYPNQYWEEIKAATPYTWDPRVFHALVREESNFNPKIKSHAGACGLSQLMPGTASACAKRMGIGYSSSLIWDIPTNLKIGAWYLNNLHSRYNGNSAVALSAYNAGEGNADRWLAARPDAPTDVYTESITFRETRFYVRRVLSTYMTYRLLYGEGALYPDWRVFNHDAVP